MDIIREWAGPLGALLAIASLLWGWLSSGEKKVAADLAAHKENQAARDKEADDATVGLASRVQLIEANMQHMPDLASLHRLELTMKDMQTQMASMVATSAATERTARRVEEFLISQAKVS